MMLIKWNVNLNPGGWRYNSPSFSNKIDFILRIVANLESMIDCFKNISIKQNNEQWILTSVSHL